ncbi:MAG: D-hexose-6-phosphate mutarotase [Acidobacteriaceae bacterium]|nr:D-hexose-6-phosphate mutarotase [Acidobacteriaceae bacterium]
MDVAELEARFAVPGALNFRTTPTGLIYALVTAPAAQATICLQGAHLTHWKPTGQKQPVLFLSERTELMPGRPIRGGVPVIFPWFGPRKDGKDGPLHGFARLQEWTLESATVAGAELHMKLSLGPSEESRALGYDHFRLEYSIRIGKTLTLDLTVTNESGVAGSDAPALTYEEALHTYFVVADATAVTVSGLAGATYLDKVDRMKEKVQPAGLLRFTGRTDRVYRNTTATCMIDDEAGRRRIAIQKADSQTTVVWNPWSELAATIPDLAPDEWRGMLCVETANEGDSAITLPAGAKHTMRAVFSVESVG